MASHEDLGIILVQSPLVVADSRHVLDDHRMVGVFTLLVQDIVCGHHVVDDVRFGNLLGAKLLLRTQVLAVIVPQVIVAGNGSQFDTSIDEKVDESRFHLGLTRLEVVSANESSMLFRKLQDTRDEGVLRRTIDKWSFLQDTSHREDCRWRDLFMARLDGLHQTLSCVVDAGYNVCIAFSVCCPEHNDLGQSMLSLEVAKNELACFRIKRRLNGCLPNILADFLDVSRRRLRSVQDIIRTIFLVCGNEIRIVNAR